MSSPFYFSAMTFNKLNVNFSETQNILLHGSKEVGEEGVAHKWAEDIIIGHGPL